MDDRIEHISDRELLSFFRGETSVDDSRRIVRHLLTGCRNCRELSAGRWDSEVAGRRTRRDDSSFDRAFERAASAALVRGSAIRTERKEAAELLAELRRHPVERQLLLVANSRRFRTYGLCEALLEAAFRSGFSDPRRATEQAEIALAVAEQLTERRYGGRLLNDLKARAWGTLGNAQRIGSRLREADEAIRRGLDHADRGTGDPTEKARLLSFLASLRTGQRRFDEALEIDNRILRIYTELGDRHMVGRTQAQMAFVLRRMGDLNKAVKMSKKALGNLDRDRNLRDVLAARQGMAHSLVGAGRLPEAANEVADLRHEFAAQGNELDVLRCEWLTGRIYHKQGQTERAEQCFHKVRDRFVELAIPYDAALANLDLAQALFDQGKMAQMKRRLAEAIPIFRALGIHRETIAALTFLRQATELEQVSVGLIRATARFVERSRRDPELRFRAEVLSDAG